MFWFYFNLNRLCLNQELVDHSKLKVSVQKSSDRSLTSNELNLFRLHKIIIILFCATTTKIRTKQRHPIKDLSHWFTIAGRSRLLGDTQICAPHSAKNAYVEYVRRFAIMDSPGAQFGCSPKISFEYFGIWKVTFEFTQNKTYIYRKYFC